MLKTIDLMDRPHKNDSSLQNEENRLLPMDGAHNTRELGVIKLLMASPSNGACYIARIS